MTDIKLIVGLGNPGPEYADTRHNAGEWYVHALARQYGATLTPESKFYGNTARINIAGRDVRLLVPTTFMNRSGQSVGALARFFKLTTDQIMVAFDELDMDPGVAKFKIGGSSSQNGIRDIVSAMGNNKQFLRLRIGIGHPGHKSRVTGHVLGKPSAADKRAIEDAIDEAVKCTELLLTDGLKRAHNELHGFKAVSN